MDRELDKLAQEKERDRQRLVGDLRQGRHRMTDHFHRNIFQIQGTVYFRINKFPCCLLPKF